MNNDMKVLVGVGVLAVAIVASSLLSKPPIVNTTVQPPAQPVVVSGDTQQGEYGGVLAGLLQSLSDQIQKLTGQISQSSEQTEFGGTTHWNSDGLFRNNLQVVGDTTLGDDITVFGEVNTTSVRRTVAKAFTSSASSQSIVSFSAPATGRFINDIHCDVATSTNTGGIYRLTASLGSATGTTVGTDLFFDVTNNASTVNNPSGHFWTPTSTLPGVASSTAGVLTGDNNNPLQTPIRFGPVWQNTSNAVTVLIASPTSTLSGTCYLDYTSGVQVGG